MIPHQFFYHLVVLGLLWLCVMLHDAWPSRCVAAPHQPAKPIMPRRKRSSDPQPFPGLTRTPPCAACAQAHASAPQLPGCPPPRIVPTRGRPRQVDTSQHCCPHPDCAYRGWVGLGNISAHGLPTICQPQFVNRYIREKIHLLKRKQASGKVDHRTGFLLQVIRQNYANPEFAHELQREAFEAGRQAKQAREKQVKMLEQHKAAIESTREKALQAM